MAWQAYTLTYQAMAPVLLGTHPLGFIQRTRYYAPGWTIWGAITARLTRACLPRATGEDYETVGGFVRENLPTSYAFLLVDGKPAMPHYENGALHYGDLAAADFEARFLASFGQTAVAPATATAQTGALHETEVLAAYDRQSGERVRWQFTLYARQPWPDPPPPMQGLTLQAVLDALETLTLGADRGYGLGRLVRVEEQGPQEAQGEGWPRPLNWAAGQPLQAHVPYGEVSGDQVRGSLEAIPWRWWQNEPAGAWGPGQKLQVRLFYVPGNEIKDEWQPVIGPLGIWHQEGWQDAPTASS